MSVINLMLQDLDERREVPAAIVLPAGAGATALRYREGPHRAKMFVSASVLLAALATLAYWPFTTADAAKLASMQAAESTQPWVAPDAHLPGQAGPAGRSAASRVGARAPSRTPASPPSPGSKDAVGEPGIAAHAGAGSSFSERRIERDAQARGADERPAPSPSTPPLAMAAASASPALAAPTPSAAKSPPASAPAANDPAKIERQTRQLAPLGRAEAAYRQGLARYNEGDLNGAVQSLRSALGEDAGYAAARQALAAILVDRREWAQAQVVLAEGLGLDPHNAQFALLSAQISMRTGEHEGALRTLQTAASEGSPAELHATLAGLLARMKRDREAVPHWMAALRRSPQQGDWWLGLAIALEADARPSEARSAFERALAIGRLGEDASDYARERVASLR